MVFHYDVGYFGRMKTVSHRLQRLAVIQYLPILIAMIVPFYAGDSLRGWTMAFGVGVICANLQFILFKHFKIKFDPFAMGMNLFLLLGFVGFYFKITKVLSWYSQLRESTAFICIIVIVLYYSLFHAKSFMGIVFRSKKQRIIIYLIMVAAAVFSALVSYQFRGDRLLSTTVPLVMLYVTRTVLKILVERKAV